MSERNMGKVASTVKRQWIATYRTLTGEAIKGDIRYLAAKREGADGNAVIVINERIDAARLVLQEKRGD